MHWDVVAKCVWELKALFLLMLSEVWDSLVPASISENCPGSILSGGVGPWLCTPVNGIQPWAPCLPLAGLETSTNQLGLEISSPVGRMDSPGSQLYSTPAQRTSYTTLILQRSFYLLESLWRSDYASPNWWSRILTSSSGIPPLISCNMNRNTSLWFISEIFKTDC